MKEILSRVWKEPAVFIGLLASAALAVITLATGDPWDAATIAAVIAPLASALGIRSLVTPTAEIAGDDPPPATQPEVKA